MIQETHQIFEDRKDEIEFYYSVMKNIEQEQQKSLYTQDNQRLFRIMKSNFILMIYNFVEATFTTGLCEIYEQLNNDNCSYNSVIDEIQNIWRDNKVKEVYKADASLSTYTQRVKEIVVTITENCALKLGRSSFGMRGNLDANNIKSICDKHKIRHKASDDNFTLEKVRKKRNSLAHGNESFSICTRDFTLNDLILKTDISMGTQIL